MLQKVNTSNTTFAPTAKLLLTQKEGNFVKGTLKKKLDDKDYPGKQNYFITVQDLEGSTVIWNKDTQTEVNLDVKVGDDVYVRGFTTLSKALADVAEGTYVEIEYTGKGRAKKGQRAAYLVNVSVDR